MPYINPVPVLFDDQSQTFVGSKKKKGSENTSDYKKLDTVYFAFIDVLGFKQTFDDIKKTSKDNKADKFRTVFNYYFELMNAAKFMEQGHRVLCRTNIRQPIFLHGSR